MLQSIKLFSKTLIMLQCNPHVRCRGRTFAVLQLGFVNPFLLVKYTTVEDGKSNSKSQMDEFPSTDGKVATLLLSGGRVLHQSERSRSSMRMRQKSIQGYIEKNMKSRIQG